MSCPKLPPDSSPKRLSAGDLTTVFLPGRGMLIASLCHRGEEILGRVENLDAAAAKGSTAGIALLHPWANRLAGLGYSAAGRSVTLDPSSPLLHFDEHGLPMHGVPWSQLAWTLTASSPCWIAARLDWTRAGLLAVFPFPHRIEMIATLASDGLTVETTLTAASDLPVPLSFGFHPYLTLPGVPRPDWRLELPPMRRLALDPRGIPTGEEAPFPGRGGALGGLDFDDGFALPDDQATFTLEGGRRRICVVFLEGYRYAQVFAPGGKDYVAIEPMTASTSALTTGRGLRMAAPGEPYHAAFRVRTDTDG